MLSFTYAGMIEPGLSYVLHNFGMWLGCEK